MWRWKIELIIVASLFKCKSSARPLELVLRMNVSMLYNKKEEWGGSGVEECYSFLRTKSEADTHEHSGVSPVIS